MGKPEEAPASGVICIPYPDELVGRVIMHGWDWYYYHFKHHQWWGSDEYGMLEYFKARGCIRYFAREARGYRTITWEYRNTVGDWIKTDRYGVVNWLLESGLVKQGENVSNKRFGELMGLADKDPDFPPKSGFLKKESPHGPRSTARRLERIA